MDEVKTKIMMTLQEMFPDAHCELNHTNRFELLIAVILSAQTTDESVNKVTARLFQKYKTPEDYANVLLADLQEDLKHLGLYKNKAQNIKNLCYILINEHRGDIPEVFDELVKLPGVGRKTANVYLTVALNKPAFAVDTHVERISKRLGIAQEHDNVLTVEKKLKAYFPEELWGTLHHELIFFGRYHCFARNPQCKVCQLTEVCRYYKNKSDKTE